MSGSQQRLACSPPAQGLDVEGYGVKEQSGSTRRAVLQTLLRAVEWQPPCDSPWPIAPPHRPARTADRFRNCATGRAAPPGPTRPRRRRPRSPSRGETARCSCPPLHPSIHLGCKGALRCPHQGTAGRLHDSGRLCNRSGHTRVHGRFMRARGHVAGTAGGRRWVGPALAWARGYRAPGGPAGIGGCYSSIPKCCASSAASSACPSTRRSSTGAPSPSLQTLQPAGQRSRGGQGAPSQRAASMGLREERRQPAAHCQVDTS